MVTTTAFVPVSVTRIVFALWRTLSLKNGAEVQQLLLLLRVKQDLGEAGPEELQDAARRLRRRVTSVEAGMILIDLYLKVTVPECCSSSRLQAPPPQAADC